jgi:phosphomannomutase
MTDKYKNEDITTIDAKIDLLNEWVHLRKSNTEPFVFILRHHHRNRLIS